MGAILKSTIFPSLFGYAAVQVNSKYSWLRAPDLKPIERSLEAAGQKVVDPVAATFAKITRDLQNS
jgi:hypothetical protein